MKIEASDVVKIWCEKKAFEVCPDWLRVESKKISEQLNLQHDYLKSTNNQHWKYCVMMFLSVLIPYMDLNIAVAIAEKVAENG